GRGAQFPRGGPMIKRRGKLCTGTGGRVASATDADPRRGDESIAWRYLEEPQRRRRVRATAARRVQGGFRASLTVILAGLLVVACSSQPRAERVGRQPDMITAEEIAGISA